MKKQNSKQKHLITAIIFSVVMLLLPSLIGYGFFWLIDVTDKKEPEYYDDGTIIYNKSGPPYDHVLFDHYSVSFTGESYSTICYIQPGNEEYYDKDRINKYTFDKNGFIAYHVADDDINEYRLFVAESKTIQTFPTMKELYDYCAEQNISLGLWYHGLHLEQVFFNNNGWTLTTNSADVSFIRHNGEELFSGQIDKYFYTPDLLFIKFQHFDISRYDEEPNPVIPVDTTIIIGKRIGRFFPFREEIYTEKYVFIDTKTDKYIIFADEDSIEEYAASLGISQNWTKIKFDEKVNN